MWVEVQRHESSFKEAFGTEKEQCYAAIRKSGLITNVKKQTMVSAYHQPECEVSQEGSYFRVGGGVFGKKPNE